MNEIIYLVCITVLVTLILKALLWKNISLKSKTRIIDIWCRSGHCIKIPDLPCSFSLKRTAENKCVWECELGSVGTWCHDKGQMYLHWVFLRMLVQKHGTAIFQPTPIYYATTELYNEYKKEVI